MPRTAPARLLLAASALAVAAGCTRDVDAAPTRARLVFAIQGFLAPESVRYDPELDVFYVSNIRGFGSIKDDNGYIVRVDAADPREMSVLVAGGRNGATLHAPKGMALQGDTLWVTDIDALRGFHRRTGQPLATLDFRPHGAVLLNDVAAGPDGSLLVTDSGILMSTLGVIFQGGEKIFSVAPDRAVSLVASDSALGHPNGVTWDPRGKRWIVVSFHPFHSRVYTLQPGDTTRRVLAEGLGRFDGVELLDDGRLLFTAWSDSSLHLLAGDRHQRVIRGLWQPADLGVDTRRGRVAIPLVLQGTVQLWELPAR